MANKKISQLDPIGTIDVNQDSIPIVDYSENTTKRTNLANIGQRVLEASTTTNLAEGTNLYFTNTRVYTKVKATLLAGSNTSITFDDALQTITIASQGNVQSVNTKTGAVVLTTTDITEGTNEYHTSARVRAVILTGLSLVTNAVISATDSVLIAFGKLQAQITANLSTLTSHTSNTSNPHATTKAQVGLGNADDTSDANKPVSTATQTALNAKQDTLVSNTNIKTVNSTSLLGSGDIAVQPTLVSGTNIKTVNGTTLLGSGDLVISTGITIGTTPITSGTVGRIFFEGTGNVVSESANLFWDNTNGRLGIGTSTPSAIIHSVGSVTATSLIARALYLNNTLVASANNDVLVGLDIAPTFTNGAFTGVTNWGLRSTGLAQFRNTSGQLVFEVNDFTRVQSGISGIFYGNGTTGNLRIYPGQSTSVFTALYFNATTAGNAIDSGSTTLSLQTNSTTRLHLFNTTGNIGIGTTTDAGYKLDVNGSVRVNSTTIPQGNSFLVLSSSNRTLSFNLSGVGGTYSSLSTGLNSATSTGSFGITLDGFGTAFIIGSSNNSTSNARFSVNLNSGNAAQTEVIIGTQTSSASSLLTLNSTVRGFLPPRMTTTQKNAITSPETGLMVYDTTLNVITYYNGTTWI